MCEAIRELMFEFYGDQLEADRAKMRQEIRQEVRLETLIEQIRKKYRKNKATDQIADELEGDIDFIAHVCQIIKMLSEEATDRDVLVKWKEMFAA